MDDIQHKALNRLVQDAASSRLKGNFDEAVTIIFDVDASLNTKQTSKVLKDQRPDRVPVWDWERTIKIVKEYHHLPYVPSVALNLLEVDEQDLTIPLDVRYKARIAKVGASEGKPVSAQADYYGWVDSELVPHFKKYGAGCFIVEVTEVINDEWDEFVDTFASSEDGNFVGFQADAKCACGYFTGQFRWASDEGSLIKSIANSFQYDYGNKL